MRWAFSDSKAGNLNDSELASRRHRMFGTINDSPRTNLKQIQFLSNGRQPYTPYKRPTVESTNSVYAGTNDQDKTNAPAIHCGLQTEQIVEIPHNYKLKQITGFTSGASTRK